MNHSHLARVLLSLLCGTQGLATLAIDLNRTHATNPSWTGHARFHVVWQSANMALLAVVELMVLWLRWPFRNEAFYLVLLLTAVSPFGFVIAVVCRKIFGGNLSDPNGIPPLPLTLFGEKRLIDLNCVAVTAAFVSIIAILKLY